MIIIDPGHHYKLSHHENSILNEEIKFVKKEQKDGKFIMVQSGTTNEEVLAMLIDRVQHLNQKASCRENSIAITHLEEALLWLNRRTADRIKRGVENTPKP